MEELVRSRLVRVAHSRNFQRIGLVLFMHWSMLNWDSWLVSLSLVNWSISEWRSSLIISPASLRTLALLESMSVLMLHMGYVVSLLCILPSAHERLVRRSPPLRNSTVPNFLCIHLYDMCCCRYTISWLSSHRVEKSMLPLPTSRRTGCCEIIAEVHP